MDLLRENQQEETIRHMLQQVYQSTARSLKSVTYVDDKGRLQTVTEDAVEPAIVRPMRSRYRKIAIAAAVLLILLAVGWWLFRNRHA